MTETDPINTPLMIRQSDYNCVDTHTSSLKAWDLDVYQLDRGCYHFAELLIVSDDIQYTYMQTSRRILNRANNWLKGFQFCFQLTDNIMPININANADEPVIWCIPSGIDIETIFPNNFYGVTLYISEALFYRWAELYKISSLCLPPRNEPSALYPSAAQHKHLCKVLISLREEIVGLDTINGDGPERSAEWLHTVTLNRIMPELIQVLEQSGNLGYCRRPQHLLNALKVIINNLTSPPSIEELAALIGTSPRNLQYLFKHHLGVSPKQFIQLCRLNTARKFLRTTPQRGGSISDAANKLGYWHMGDFSRQFRALFNQLPREYLQSRNGQQPG